MQGQEENRRNWRVQLCVLEIRRGEEGERGDTGAGQGEEQGGLRSGDEIWSFVHSQKEKSQKMK